MLAESLAKDSCNSQSVEKVILRITCCVYFQKCFGFWCPFSNICLHLTFPFKTTTTSGCRNANTKENANKPYWKQILFFHMANTHSTKNFQLKVGSHIQSAKRISELQIGQLQTFKDWESNNVTFSGKVSAKEFGT